MSNLFLVLLSSFFRVQVLLSKVSGLGFRCDGSLIPREPLPAQFGVFGVSVDQRTQGGGVISVFGFRISGFRVSDFGPRTAPCKIPGFVFGFQVPSFLLSKFSGLGGGVQSIGLRFAL